MFSLPFLSMSASLLFFSAPRRFFFAFIANLIPSYFFGPFFSPGNLFFIKNSFSHGLRDAPFPPPSVDGRSRPQPPFPLGSVGARFLSFGRSPTKSVEGDLSLFFLYRSPFFPFSRIRGDFFPPSGWRERFSLVFPLFYKFTSFLLCKLRNLFPFFLGAAREGASRDRALRRSPPLLF